MRSFAQLWGSTIARKWIMAVTGIGLVLFLFGHLAGNMLVFMGPEDMNSYAYELQHLLHGAGIWVARIGLLVFATLHIWSAFTLTRRIRAARPQGYAKVEHRTSSIASRSMAISGLVILTYVIYHLAHFTWGAVHTEFYDGTYTLANGTQVHDVYAMIIASFRQPLIAVLYVLAMVFTGLHLNHAIQSALQTLGINHPRYTPMIRKGGAILSIVLAAGFSSVPLSILLGLVGGSH
jgi:succinate dehydrogenase / fumarate reductase cytochrome b subunit